MLSVFKLTQCIVQENTSYSLSLSLTLFFVYQTKRSVANFSFLFRVRSIISCPDRGASLRVSRYSIGSRINFRRWNPLIILCHKDPTWALRRPRASIPCPILSPPNRIFFRRFRSSSSLRLSNLCRNTNEKNLICANEIDKSPITRFDKKNS